MNALFYFVCFLSGVVLAEDASSTSKNTKRGIQGLSGVPGVLYSQYSPHVHTVPVPHPVPVPVPHPVPVQVPRPFPVTVHKPVGLPVPVGVPVPVHVPVPKPYPVPVPVNIPSGGSGIGAFSGAAGPFGASPFGGSPFGGSPFANHPLSFGGAFSGSFGASGPEALNSKFGYGLGIYGHPGTPSIPPASPGLAASLGPSPFGHSAAVPPFPDPLTGHPSKY